MKTKDILKGINELKEFLECDLYTKFRPCEDVNGELWIRKDYFKNKKEFLKYLDGHFKILIEEIKK